MVAFGRIFKIGADLQVFEPIQYAQANVRPFRDVYIQNPEIACAVWEKKINGEGFYSLRVPSVWAITVFTFLQLLFIRRAFIIWALSIYITSAFEADRKTLNYLFSFRLASFPPGTFWILMNRRIAPFTLYYFLFLLMRQRPG